MTLKFIRPAIVMKSKSSPHIYYTVYNWASVKKTLFPEPFFDNNIRGFYKPVEKEITIEQMMNDIDGPSQFIIKQAYYHDMMNESESDNLPPFLL